MSKGIAVGGVHRLREYTVSVAKTERDTVVYVSEDLRRAGKGVAAVAATAAVGALLVYAALKKRTQG